MKWVLFHITYTTYICMWKMTRNVGHVKVWQTKGQKEGRNFNFLTFTFCLLLQSVEVQTMCFTNVFQKYIILYSSDHWKFPSKWGNIVNNGKLMTFLFPFGLALTKHLENEEEMWKGRKRNYRGRNFNFDWKEISCRRQGSFRLS